MNSWKLIDKNTPHDKFFEVCGPSGYMNVPIRIHVAQLSSAYHRWRTHSNDDFTDGGEQPTHYRELDIPIEYLTPGYCFHFRAGDFKFCPDCGAKRSEAK